MGCGLDGDGRAFGGRRRGGDVVRWPAENLRDATPAAPATTAARIAPLTADTMQPPARRQPLGCVRQLYNIRPATLRVRGASADTPNTRTRIASGKRANIAPVGKRRWIRTSERARSQEKWLYSPHSASIREPQYIEA